MPASGDECGSILTALVLLILGVDKGQRRGGWSARLSRVREGFLEERLALKNDGRRNREALAEGITSGHQQ